MAHYRMSDVVCEINERENSPSSSKYERFVGLEHYVSGEVEIRQFGSTDKLESAMKVFHSGDILVARRNVYLKRAATVNFDGLTSGDSIVLRANDSTIGRLLPFVLNTSDFWDFAEQHADGTMSKRLSPKTLLQYEFDLPDREDQEQFADTLWAAEETKYEYQNLLAKTDELVKSQFIEMFGDPIKNPKGWPKKQLQELVTADCTISYGIVQTGDDQPEGVPVFRPIDVVGDMPTISSLKKTTKEISNKYKRTLLKGRELLITVRANIADTRIIGEVFKGCNVGRGVVPIRTREDIMPLEFLKGQMDFDSMNQYMKSLAKGVTLIQLNMDDLRKVELIVPPLELQKQYMKLIEQSDKSKFELKKAIENIDELMRSLMQQDFSN